MKSVLPLFMLCILTSFFIQAAEVSIDDDGMFVINGERSFVLGLYENPKEDEQLARMVEAGFNLVQAQPKAEELDRLDRHGVYGWVNTGSCIDLSVNREQREKELTALVGTLKDHPRLLVWEVPDEALWNCWHQPQQWRWHQEPEALRQKIKEVADDDKRAQLFAEVNAALAYRDIADYETWEKRMDMLWEALGLEQPHPELSMARAQERAELMCRGMIDGYHLTRKMAPGIPVWMNHAPRNQISQLAAFNEGADIVGCDIYPVPRHPAISHSDLDNALISSVADYTVRMQAAAPWKPVWMVLQGFGWGDIQPNQSEQVRKELRRPNFGESRFMAYDAIARGAKGILYWGTAYVEKESEFLTELLRVIRELHELQPVLSAPRAALDITVSYRPTFGSVDRKPVVLPKAYGKIPWLIAVNEWSEGLACTLSGFGNLEGVRYRDHHTGETYQVTDGVLPVPFRRYSARVLEPVVE